MKKCNMDIRLLLLTNEIYAYELADELGIGQTTYTTKMRKELSCVDRAEFVRAIERITKRKAKESVIIL